MIQNVCGLRRLYIGEDYLKDGCEFQGLPVRETLSEILDYSNNIYYFDSYAIHSTPALRKLKQRGLSLLTKDEAVVLFGSKGVLIDEVPPHGVVCSEERSLDLGWAQGIFWTINYELEDVWGYEKKRACSLFFASDLSFGYDDNHQGNVRGVLRWDQGLPKEERNIFDEGSLRHTHVLNARGDRVKIDMNHCSKCTHYRGSKVEPGMCYAKKNMHTVVYPTSVCRNFRAR